MTYNAKDVLPKLDQETYKYTDKRASGDGKFKGGLDRTEVNKKESYEVAYFIAQYLNEYKKPFSLFSPHVYLELSDVSEIEVAMHSFSGIKNRDELAEKIANELGHEKK